MARPLPEHDQFLAARLGFTRRPVDPGRRLLERLKALKPRLQQGIGEGGAAAEAVKQRVAEVKAAVEKKDYAEADRLLAALEEQLAQAAAVLASMQTLARVPGAYPHEQAEVEAACQKVRDALTGAASQEAVQAAKGLLDGVRIAAADAAGKVKKRLDARRAALEKEVWTFEVPAEAPEGDREDLERLRGGVLSRLGDGMTQDQLDEVAVSIAPLPGRFTAVRQAVEAAKADKVKILSDADVEAAALHADATATMKGRVESARKAVDEVYTTHAPEVSEAVNGETRGKVMDLKKQVGEENALVKRRGEIKKEYDDSYAKGPEGVNRTDKVEIQKLRDAVAKPLAEEPTTETLKQAAAALPPLKEKFEAVQRAVAGKLKEVKDRFGDLSNDVEKTRRFTDLLESYGAAALEFVSKNLGGSENTLDLAGQYTPDELLKLIEQFGEDTADTGQKRAAKGAELIKEFLAETGGAEGLKKLTKAFDKPKALVDLAAGPLGGKRKALVQMLRTGCGDDPAKLKQALAAFNNDFAPLQNLMSAGGLGGKIKDKSDGPERDAPPEALGEVLKAVGANGADGLKKFCDACAPPAGDPAKLKGLVEGGFGAKPGCLGQALTAFGAAADPAGAAGKLAQLKDNIAGVTFGPGLMKSFLLADGGVGDNPEVFGKLLGVGFDGDPAKFTRLFRAGNADNLGRLNGLVKDSNLAAQPECLAQLLKVGCDGSPARLVGFSEANKDGPGRQNLKGLLEKGGLGTRPEALGRLLKTGSEAELRKALERKKNAMPRPALGAVAPAVTLSDGETNAANDAAVKQVRDLAAAFTDEKDLQQLANLINKGLGGDPGVLGSLLAVGCNGDANKFKALVASYPVPDTDKLQQEDPIAKAQEKDLKDLADFLSGGGLADNPDAFGCLVQAATPEKIKDLVKAFANEGDRKSLAAVLDQGGMGAKPQALGKVLSIGCGNDLGKLKAFVAAYPPPDADPPTDPTSQQRQQNLNNLGGLIGQGGLGDNPDVLGHLVAVGCAGKADKLQSLGAAFNNEPAKLQKLETMIKTGGLGGQPGDKPDALGKIYRDAFPDAPGKFVDLYDGFQGGQPPQGMAPLKTLLDVYTDASKGETEPGQRLKTLLRRLNTPAAGAMPAQKNWAVAGLKTRFYDTLKRQDQAYTTGTTFPPNPTALGLNLGAAQPVSTTPMAELIRIAPQFPKKAPTGAAPGGIPPATANVASNAAATAAAAADNAANEAEAEAPVGNAQAATAVAQTRTAKTAGDNAAAKTITASNKTNTAAGNANGVKTRATDWITKCRNRNRGQPADAPNWAAVQNDAHARQGALAASLADARNERQLLITEATNARAAATAARAAAVQAEQAHATAKGFSDIDPTNDGLKNAADEAKQAADACGKAAGAAEQTADAAEKAVVAVACRDINAVDMTHAVTRHVRETFDFALADETAVNNAINNAGDPVGQTINLARRKPTTFFPDGVTEADVAAMVDEALRVLAMQNDVPTEADILNGFAQAMAGGLGAGDKPPDTFVRKPVNLGAKFGNLRVQIGFELSTAVGGKIEVTQFFPLSAPAPGLQTIDFYDMHAVKRAVNI
jgi:hypothetical protein